MFAKRKKKQTLDPPPMAADNPDAIEILRVWAASGKPQQLRLRNCWKDPGAWGLMLADIARHVAKAYERDGQDPESVILRIREMFDAEWDTPTDEPLDLSDHGGD